MTTKMSEMGIVLILALILCRGATAQSSCSSMINSLSSCISYVTGNSSTPLLSCCSSLASVVNSKPKCLCPLLSNGAGASLGVAINRTLALALPVTCNVQTPPVSQCNAVANRPAGVPAASPLSPPTDASSEPPKSPAATTPISIPSGSKTVPTASGSTSDVTTVMTSDGTTMTTLIYVRIVTLFTAVWMVNAFHYF